MAGALAPLDRAGPLVDESFAPRNMPAHFVVLELR